LGTLQKIDNSNLYTFKKINDQIEAYVMVGDYEA